MPKNIFRPIKMPRVAAHMTFLAFALLLTFTSSPLHVSAATLPSGFTETTVASGLSNPTAFAIHPDGRIFICQQGGALRIVKNGALLITPFMTLTVNSTGERGLLGIAFDPNYATNKYIYVYYTVPTPLHNRVSRFTADSANEDIVVPGSELPILDLETLSASNHNGGPIHFGPDGKLYIAVGENAVPSNAQSLSNRLGKMLRINSDGTIPADNPTSFPNVSGTPSGVNQSIWAVGLRNPFTFAFQQGTGRMYINDVGQNTWEEVDDGIAGTNYGWSTCEGNYVNGSTTTLCTTPGMTLPVYTYSSGTGASECTVIGGDFYNPTNVMFPASYVGKYFLGDYCAGWIKYVDPANPSALGTAPTFASGIGFGLVDIHVSNDGTLYYLSRGTGSPLIRVQYAASTPTNTPTNTPTSTNTPTITPTSTPTATPSGSISGRVSYANASAPPAYVSNVLISGAGSANVSTTSAAPGPVAGTYTLTGFGSGSYTVTPSKIGGSNGISSFDSARISQHVAGLPPLLSSNQLIAADASANGSISSLDAAQIAQFVVTTVGGHAGEWVFLPTSRTYGSVSGNIAGEDYTAYLIGEISGNWNNTGARSTVGSTARFSTIVAPNLVTKVGEEIVIPVAVQGIANKGVISYEFDLRYDPAVIQPGKSVVELAGTVSRGLISVVNAEVPGLLRVAVYGPMPINSSGVLMNLKFTAIGIPGASSPLIWERMMLNEGSPFVKTIDGQIELF